MRVGIFPNKTSIVYLGGAKATREGAGESETAPAPETTASFQPTGDIQSLLLSLQLAPVIRQELVADVADRLRAGELNTPRAKEETVGVFSSPARSLSATSATSSWRITGAS